MKHFRQLIFLLLGGIALCSCDHAVSSETVVFPDGRLEKSFTFVDKDSVKNILGLRAAPGWTRTVNPVKLKGKDTQWSITWKKTFSSAADANTELAAASDTLLRISSSFEKEFRWFYTYMVYADTFHTVNNMQLSIGDYVTPEDKAFINRLPAEGKPISRADSLYLSELNKKLFDVYGLRSIFESYYDLHLALIRDNQLEARWLDTLKRHKEKIFDYVKNNKDAEDEFFLHAMDSLHIPLPYEKITKSYKAILKPATVRIDFVSAASNGKYINHVSMPWAVVKTNADSIVGDHLFWKPSSIKFLIQDYTMYAEARKMNYWAVMVSALIVGGTGWMLRRRK